MSTYSFPRVSRDSFRQSLSLGGLLVAAGSLVACHDDATGPERVIAPTVAPAVAGTQAWVTMPSPNKGTLANTLEDLAIVSSSDIWAVGEWNPGVPPTATGRRTLIEHWNGSTWQIVPSPNASWTGVDLSTLEAVAAVSSNSVWAVGHANDFGSFKSTTLIVHWDGTQWKMVPSPNPGGANYPNELHDLAIVSSNDIWAVGFQGYPERPLILHWNGTTWSNVPNNCGDALYAITAISATNLWAVGDGTTCRYNGQTWTRVALAEYVYFTDVTGVSTNEVWAVGREYYCVYYCQSVSHISKWNGNQWTEVLHPTGSTWNGVHAIAANNVWAVGDNATYGLALQWNGTAWKQVPVPNIGQATSLSAVKAAGAQIWAVGQRYTSNGIPRTWTLRR